MLAGEVTARDLIVSSGEAGVRDRTWGEVPLT